MCCGLSARSIWWCFLFFMSGFALLGVGIWTPVDVRVFDAVTAFRPGLEDNPAAWRGWIGGLIALGSWSIIVGIVGMAGAGCDDDDKVKNTLIAFAVLGSLGCIGCIIFSAIATAGYATENKTSYLARLNEELKENYHSQLAADGDDFILAWNRYQIDEKCCGVESYMSYDKSEYTNTSAPGEANVPWSCCVLNADRDNEYYPVETDVVNSGVCTTESSDYNTPPVAYTSLNENGCGDEMWNRFNQWQVVVMSIGWTATFIQIVAMIVTGCLKKDAMMG